jgi:RHS repeat-associated protein
VKIPTPQLVRISDPVLVPIASLTSEAIDTSNHSQETLWEEFLRLQLKPRDRQGSIRDVLDNTGTLQNHIVYDSFGKITSQTNAFFTSIYAYTGREYDSETGLYFYRARYYDPNTGGFISEDPIGFEAGDNNLYRHVGNSPTNANDPSDLN